MERRIKIIALLLSLNVLFYSLAISGEDNSAEQYFQSSKMLMAENKKEEAFNALKRVIEIDSNYNEAYGAIMKLCDYSMFCEARSSEELLPLFEKTIEINRLNPIPQYCLGAMYEFVGLVFDAKKAYEKALALNAQGFSLNGQPLDELIQSHLKTVDYRIDSLKQKIRKMEGFPQGSENEMVKFCIEKGFANETGIDTAGELFQLAIHLMPDNPQVAKAYYGMASICGYGGRAYLFKHYLRKAIQLDPNCVSQEDLKLLEDLEKVGH